MWLVSLLSGQPRSTHQAKTGRGGDERRGEERGRGGEQDRRGKGGGEKRGGGEEKRIEERGRWEEERRRKEKGIRTEQWKSGGSIHRLIEVNLNTFMSASRSVCVCF